MVQPLSRNAVDAYAGVNTQRCSNLTGDKCSNGQAAFWYGQGQFHLPFIPLWASRDPCPPTSAAKSLLWFGHLLYRNAMATPVLGWVPEPSVHSVLPAISNWSISHTCKAGVR